MAQASKVLRPTETRILEVATQRFYARGYHATTMRDIAAGVGIKAGSLYNHFAGKEEILFRLCQAACRALYEGAVERLDGVDDVEERLRLFVLWHVSFHAEQGAACRVTDTQMHFLEPEGRGAVLATRDAYESILRDILLRGVAEARWSVENLSVIVNAIGTMCSEVDVWYRDDGRLSPQQVGDIFATFIRQGLGAPPVPPGRRSATDGAADDPCRPKTEN